MNNYTYMLRCADGSYYTGWTNNLEKRIQAHRAGKGGKYTRSHLPVELVWYEAHETKHEAMQREWEIKQMTKKEKEKLIANMTQDVAKPPQNRILKESANKTRTVPPPRKTIPASGDMPMCGFQVASGNGMQEIRTITGVRPIAIARGGNQTQEQKNKKTSGRTEQTAQTREKKAEGDCITPKKSAHTVNANQRWNEKGKKSQQIGTAKTPTQKSENVVPQNTAKGFTAETNTKTKSSKAKSGSSGRSYNKTNTRKNKKEEMLTATAKGPVEAEDCYEDATTRFLRPRNYDHTKKIDTHHG